MGRRLPGDGASRYTTTVRLCTTRSDASRSRLVRARAAPTCTEVGLGFTLRSTSFACLADQAYEGGRLESRTTEEAGPRAVAGNPRRRERRSRSPAPPASALGRPGRRRRAAGGGPA